MGLPDYLHWPFFEDRHRQHAKALDTWARARLPALLEDDEKDAMSATRRLVAALAEGGWLDAAVSSAPGRAPDSLTLCLSRDILASYGALADFAFAMQGLGSGPIGLCGDTAQRQRYLPDVKSGRSIAAFALTEPDAGSDVAALKTTARRDGDDYVLDGTKTFISNAGLAGFYVVFARTGVPGPRGLSAFIVDADTPGLEVSEQLPVISPHPIGVVRLASCRVPAGRRLGEEGQGFAIAMGTLDVFRVSVGAAALGLSRCAFQQALDRVREREIFGAKLATYQLTQAKIADMAVGVDASALLVYRAAWTKASLGGRTTREASMAKLFATEQAQLVIDQAVQLFGGLGVVHGSTVERLYRDVRALRIYEGTSEVQKLVIAAQYLKGGH
ncbi:MAG: acyl-CoA dehydrogenase family protein [Stagnimonas sp.]|jgi:acyl-CoA dehydrogenase|nr:acyl-CoA dehydrogenase family protein [Stagnimonas sp.]